MLDRGHYRTALKIYHRLADSGDALAQDDLGYMYYLGLGTHQDFAKARKWFHRAADQAHSPAQFNLAVLYHRGQGVGKDRTNAYKWFDLWAVFATTVERRQLATGHQKELPVKCQLPPHATMRAYGGVPIAIGGARRRRDIPGVRQFR
jgi:hypothetical protein